MKTMTIQAIFPLLEYTGFSNLLKFKRWKDRGFSSDEKKSKQVSIQNYADLYSGPEYLIHFRYATLLLFLYIAMIYGTAIPFLWLISMLGYTVYWFNERKLIFNYYRAPPAYDIEITETAFFIISISPFFSLPIAFWQLGNRQIFDNILVGIKTSKDVRLSSHTIPQVLKSLTENPF
jgi:hypothetical protein